MRRAPSWDEAIYLSQVTRGANAVFFAPFRARGITLLVAPMTLAGAPLWLVRLMLAVLSSAALAAVFWIWIPLLGVGAPLAAGFFGFTWLGLFYGSEAMPNLWSALFGAAAAGLTIRATVEGRRVSATAAALLGAATLVRPLDAVALAFALCAVVAVSRAPRSSIVVLAVGVAAGWAPWLVEMSARFGGPLRALSDAGAVTHLQSISVLGRLRAHLSLTDGPTVGSTSTTALPVGGFAWWLGMFGLGAFAAIRDRRNRPWILAALACGAALFGEYILIVTGLAPRYLLPAYALFAVPAARGATLLASRPGTAGRALRAGLVVALGSWVTWQSSLTIRNDRHVTEARADFVQIGRTLADLSAGRECRFASSDGYPQIQFVSGCTGVHLPDDAPEPPFLRRGGAQAVYLVRTRADGQPTGTWTHVAVPGPSLRDWIVYERAPGPPERAGGLSR